MSRTIPQTLTISTGISRGRETDGYRIVRLRDSDTGKLYRCMGGGYDMVGTVLADWLTDVHQGALRTIRDRAYYISDTGSFVQSRNPAALYGMTKYTTGRVSIDGACGVGSVRRIAKAAGRAAPFPVVRRSTRPFRHAETAGLVLLGVAFPLGCAVLMLTDGVFVGVFAGNLPVARHSAPGHASTIRQHHSPRERHRT